MNVVQMIAVIGHFAAYERFVVLEHLVETKWIVVIVIAVRKQVRHFLFRDFPTIKIRLEHAETNYYRENSYWMSSDRN